MNVVLTRTETSVLGSGDKVTIWDYDDDGNNQPNENPTGLLYRIIEQGYTRNHAGDVVPYAYVTKFTYNDKGQVLTIDGALPGDEDFTEYEYNDTNGDLLNIERPLIGGTTFTDYDSAGNVGKITDVNGQSTRFDYDERGRLTTVFHDADGSSAGVTYTLAGLPETTTDEDGVIYMFEYDPEFGRLVEKIDPEDNYITYFYDLRGNLVEKSKHNPAGTSFSRKRWNFKDQPEIPGKLFKEINYDDSFTEYHYDSAGNIESIKDPEGHLTQYEYDALNRPIKVIQTIDQSGDTITSYGYDIHDNLTAVTDAEGHVTTFEFDDMGRVVATTSPDTGTNTYVYDEAGNPVAKTDANGIETRYNYDVLDRLTAIRFPDSIQDIHYSYDKQETFGVGLLSEIIDPSGKTEFGYNKRGRLAAKTSTINGVSYPLYRVLTPGNRVIFISYPSGRQVNYSRYESSLKLEAVSTTYNTVTKNLLSNLRYNPFGSASGMSTGSGGKVNNQSSECACLEVINPGAMMEQRYTYDSNRNLKSITAPTTNWFNRQYDYDALNRLVRATGNYGTIEYTYDRVGNRLSRKVKDQTETYVYVPGTNRLSEISGPEPAVYSYDANGNITQINNRKFIYNQDNRLSQVKQDDNILAEYTYNGLGQRAAKEVEGAITVFHYDFNGNIIAEGRPDGTYTAEYLYMGTSRLAKIDSSTGNLFFFLNNYLNTPLLMTKEIGSVVWEAFYKPFGEADISRKSEIVNNFRFPGQYYDKETGLHYNWHRYYDPKTGRYLMRDPIGLAGGINLYAYVSNDPINWFDSDGLARKPGKTPPTLWPQLPQNLGGKKPKWKPEGYWEGAKRRRYTWDDRSHGAGVDRGEGQQEGHWDEEKTGNRYDENGEPLPGNRESRICSMSEEEYYRWSGYYHPTLFIYVMPVNPTVPGKTPLRTPIRTPLRVPVRIPVVAP